MDSQVDFWASKNSQISGGVAVMVPAAAPPAPTTATTATAPRVTVQQPARPVAGATVAPAGPVSTTRAAFAGSLPTPAHYDPSKLPALPCLRRWSADEVRTKLHEPLDAMRVRRGLPALTGEQRAKLVGEYVLRKVVGAERAPGISPPAGNGGGAGECGGDTAAAGGDAAADSANLTSNLIPICGSLAFWLDPYGKWHCCECDPWKGKPGGPGSKMCRGYHVVDRVSVGGEGAKAFVVPVDDEGYRDDETGGPLEMIMDVADLGWALRE